MNIFAILILGVIQGAAELLPVSSSAHVILAAKLMGIKTSSPQFVFLLIMLHTGTMFAVLYSFWPRWRWLLVTSAPPGAAGSERGSRRNYWKMLILTTLCTGALRS